jgi:hypothetical protein
MIVPRIPFVSTLWAPSSASNNPSQLDTHNTEIPISDIQMVKTVLYDIIASIESQQEISNNIPMEGSKNSLPSVKMTSGESYVQNNLLVNSVSSVQNWLQYYTSSWKKSGNSSNTDSVPPSKDDQTTILSTNVDTSKKFDSAQCSDFINEIVDVSQQQDISNIISNSSIYHESYLSQLADLQTQILSLTSDNAMYKSTIDQLREDNMMLRQKADANEHKNTQLQDSLNSYILQLNNIKCQEEVWMCTKHVLENELSILHEEYERYQKNSNGFISPDDNYLKNSNQELCKRIAELEMKNLTLENNVVKLTNEISLRDKVIADGNLYKGRLDGNEGMNSIEELTEKLNESNKLNKKYEYDISQLHNQISLLAAQNRMHERELVTMKHEATIDLLNAQADADEGRMMQRHLR